jgi:recombination protein RecA
MSYDKAKMAAAMLAAVGENSEDTEPKFWLDMGYLPLNEMISGNPAHGLAGGRMYEIAGPSASGKTLMATQAMIAAQRAGGIAIFIDWEQTFNATFATRLGLDCSPGAFIYKRAQTWEEGNTVAMKAAAAARKMGLPDSAPIVVVFDSIAAAVPKSMLFDSKGNRREIDEYTMNDTTALARVTSTTLKSINQLVGQLNVTAIYLNQIRTKPGVVYGDPTTTPGGGAMEFYATTRLFTGREKEMKTVDGEKIMEAAIIGITSKKNKLHRPFLKSSIRLAYKEDGLAYFDFTTGYIDELCRKGKLEEKAGRVTFEGKVYWKAALAKKIDEEGRQAELVKLYLS